MRFPILLSRPFSIPIMQLEIWDLFSMPFKYSPSAVSIRKKTGKFLKRKGSERREESEIILITSLFRLKIPISKILKKKMLV